jgi:hypothetical protein
MFQSNPGIFFQFHNYESGRDAVKGWTVLTPPLPHTTNFPITTETYTPKEFMLEEVFHNLLKAFNFKQNISVEV